MPSASQLPKADATATFQSRRPDGIATASRHSRRGPSVFTSGRSPRTTEIHRLEPIGWSTANDGKRATAHLTVRGRDRPRGGLAEPRRIGQRNGESGQSNRLSALFEFCYDPRISPGGWERVRTSSQRCGSTMTVPTLPPRSTSLWAAAVSCNGKRAATDRIRAGEAVQAAISD